MPSRNRKRYVAHIEFGKYSGDSVIVPVCPRSPGVRGRNFEATVKALAERIDHVHLLICDTLDRHNLDSDTPELDAKRNGDRWLEENLPVLEKYIQSYDLKRWDDVRNDPAYKDKLDTLKQLYLESDDVKTAIDNVASYYLVAKEERCAKKNEPFEREKEESRSVGYLIEEFAGTATYNNWYNLPEAYWGIYVSSPDIFNMLNTVDQTVDLSLPQTIPVKLNRIGASKAGEAAPQKMTA